MAASDGDGCPVFDDITLENGKESYPNILMSVKESSPPGFSGVGVMPLGLTKRPITVTGLLVGDDTDSLAVKQAAWEAKTETFLTGVFTTANGREFRAREMGVRDVDRDQGRRGYGQVRFGVYCPFRTAWPLILITRSSRHDLPRQHRNLRTERTPLRTRSSTHSSTLTVLTSTTSSPSYWGSRTSLGQARSSTSCVPGTPSS